MQERMRNSEQYPWTRVDEGGRSIGLNELQALVWESRPRLCFPCQGRRYPASHMGAGRPATFLKPLSTLHQDMNVN